MGNEHKSIKWDGSILKQLVCLPIHYVMSTWAGPFIVARREGDTYILYLFTLTLEVMIIKRINPYFSCIESFLENWTEKKEINSNPFVVNEVLSNSYHVSTIVSILSSHWIADTWVKQDWRRRQILSTGFFPF